MASHRLERRAGWPPRGPRGDFYGNALSGVSEYWTDVDGSIPGPVGPDPLEQSAAPNPGLERPI